MNAPRTAAGRALLLHFDEDDKPLVLPGLLAIEAEAAALDTKAVEAGLRAALPGAFLASDDLGIGAEAFAAAYAAAKEAGG